MQLAFGHRGVNAFCYPKFFMGEDTPRTIELQCTGCKTSFRLTPKTGSMPPQSLPCPRCRTAIAVPPQDVGTGWSRISHDRVFHNLVDKAPASTASPPAGLPRKDSTDKRLSPPRDPSTRAIDEIPRTSPQLFVPRAATPEETTQSDPPYRLSPGPDSQHVFATPPPSSRPQNKPPARTEDSLFEPTSLLHSTSAADGSDVFDDAFASPLDMDEASETSFLLDDGGDSIVHRVDHIDTFVERLPLVSAEDGAIQSLAGSPADEAPPQNASFRVDSISTSPEALQPQKDEVHPEVVRHSQTHQLDSDFAPSSHEGEHPYEVESERAQPDVSPIVSSLDVVPEHTDSQTSTTEETNDALPIALSSNFAEHTPLSDTSPEQPALPDELTSPVEADASAATPSAPKPLTAEALFTPDLWAERTPLPQKHVPLAPDTSRRQAADQFASSTKRELATTEAEQASILKRSMSRQTVFAIASTVLALVVIITLATKFYDSSEHVDDKIVDRNEGLVTNPVHDADSHSPTPPSASDAIALASLAILNAREISPLELAEHALEHDGYQLARRILVDSYDAVEDKSQLQALFDRSLTDDPALEHQLITIGKDEHVDDIRALGGGHSITLRMTRDGVSAFAFKPSQKDWVTWWKAEVAAYLLCEILVCHFEVPVNRPARIERSLFDELYGRIDTTRQQNYAARFTNLNWVIDSDDTGQQQEYLYGTLKDWVPTYVHWPIEYHDIWRPWVSLDSPNALLDKSLSEALQTLKSRQDGRFYQSILNEKGASSTRDIARQLSSLVLFDYLINNFDRFSGIEAYYGVNNHFANGVFVSIDNGAGFQFEPRAIVQRRMDWVSRFSRSTINSLRLLRPEVVNSILFPDPTPTEHKRLDVFWAQREQLLSRIDQLIEIHGEEAVLYFR